MATLWRALALAWLGGVASPALMDEAAVAGTAVECVADKMPAANVALRLAALEEEPAATALEAPENPRG